jgi:hypothetical protein
MNILTDYAVDKQINLNAAGNESTSPSMRNA